MEPKWALGLDRSGRRQLRSRSYNCAVWHTYPGNFREGSTQRAVINQCLNPRQVNGEEEKNECEDREREEHKEMERDIVEGDTEPESGGYSRSAARLRSPNRIRLLPNLFFFPSLCSPVEIYLFWDYFSSVNSSLETWWMIKWLYRGSAAH